MEEQVVAEVPMPKKQSNVRAMIAAVVIFGMTLAFLVFAVKYFGLI